MSEVMEGFRLSPQQQRLIRLQPSSCFFTAAIDVAGPFDTAAFERALGSVTRQHEVLRTTFQSTTALQLPLQVIEDSVELALATQDAGEAPCFDLARGPLLHVIWRERAEGCGTLTFVASALIADAHTVQRVAREAMEAYLGRSAGESQSKWRFADIAQWFRDLLDSPESAAARHYWRFFDADAVARQVLASQTAAPSASCEWEELEIGAAPTIAQQVRVRAAQWGVSERAVYLLPFVLLLQRALDASDTTVAVRCDARAQEELRAILGPLDRFVPLRWSGTGVQSTADALRGLHGALQDAQEWHLYFAFAFAPGEGELRRVPFGFDFIELIDPPRCAGTVFRWASLNGGSEPFTLQLTVCAQHGSTFFRYRFDRERLDPRYVRLINDQYSTLLAETLLGGNLPTSALRMLSDQERPLVLPADGAGSMSPAGLVHARFEEAARRTPDAPALFDENDVVSYRELNARADSVALGLKALGVAPETPVGLSFEMRSEAIVALLAILKAGGACVPLDAQAPRVRLEKMIDVARLKLVLASGDSRQHLSDLPVTCVPLDDLRPLHGAGARRAVLSADNLAYVMFTSGSTGVPKGVAISHATVDRYVQALHQRLQLPAMLTMATPASLYADFAYTVIFGALCTGRAIRIVPHARVLGADTLAHALADAQFIKIVPSHLAALGDGDTLPRELLRGTLMFGGEVLTRQLLDRVRRNAPHARIFNHYGPTETTIGVSVCDVGACAPYDTPAIPIGTPLSHTGILILDANLEPVPIGVPGQLYVREGALARGYLHRPDLTAQAFVPDPHAGCAGARLYRTGDRGRRLCDGSIEFLGRADRQVKIRGYRVELAEIEQELSMLPGIRHVVVKLVGDARGRASLAAYLMEEEAGRWSPAALHGALRPRLPAQMLPAAYVRLDALPRLSNGKIDLVNLPLPTARDLPRSGGGGAPRSHAERLICDIWRELLETDEIGTTDNFFDVGGHSLLLIKLRGRLVQRFGREIPIVDLFKRTTVRAQAQYMEAAAPADSHAARSTARGAERRAVAGRGRRRKPRVEEHG